MTDRREAILTRLLALAQGVDGIVWARRNEDAISETSRPALALLDGAETAVRNRAGDETRNRTITPPRFIDMRPIFVLNVGKGVDNVGTTLNRFRLALLSAVLKDATLAAITLNGNGVVYEGCDAVEIEPGRTVEGAMGINFAVTYLLNPKELE